MVQFFETLALTVSDADCRLAAEPALRRDRDDGDTSENDHESDAYETSNGPLN